MWINDEKGRLINLNEVSVIYAVFTKSNLYPEDRGLTGWIVAAKNNSDEKYTLYRTVGYEQDKEVMEKDLNSVLKHIESRLQMIKIPYGTEENNLD